MEKYNITLEETYLDYPSPDGNAVIIYMIGCEHHCPGCHSPLLQQNLEYAESNQEILEKIKNYAHRADTNKLVFLGGDPMYSKNLELTTFLVNNLSEEFEICIFTGYNIDYIKKINLKGVKYWKCGTFDINNVRKSMKTDDEYVLASPNQDFYDGNYEKLSENGILNFNNLNEGN